MVESLLSKITEYFPKRKISTLRNILLLSLCILDKETICLNKLKGVLGVYTGKDSKPSSNYKRLIRIFNNHSRKKLWLELINFGFQLLRLKTEYLVIDGTKWQRGERWFHYMTLCIVYKGVAIPIYWTDLSKSGISNIAERKEMLGKAIKHFDLKGKMLLGDREYIGLDWFNYLVSNEINFIIRIKKNMYKKIVDAEKGLSHQQMTDKVLRSKLANKTLAKQINLNGLDLKFAAVKNPKKDPKDPVIYLVTNLIEMQAKEIAYGYCIRTKIEHCFKQLKSNGFNLEQINLRTKTRCRLLMAVTVFTYVLSVHEGLKEYDQIPIKTFNDGTKEKAVSVFRNGIDQLIKFTRSIEKFCAYILTEIYLANKSYKSPFKLNVQ